MILGRPRRSRYRPAYDVYTGQPAGQPWYDDDDDDDMLMMMIDDDDDDDDDDDGDDDSE